MKGFRYARDPLCLLACLAYALNHWVMGPATASPFLRGTFNDLLLIPAALPPLLWLQRRFKLRLHDLPPTPAEIFGHWFVWSVICEGLGPLLFSRAVADWYDVVAYAIGAVVAGLWWNRPTSSFDILAPHYGWMEAVLAQKKLHHTRTAFLPELPACRQALLIGEGHGRFLVEALKSQPSLQITCVDSSAGMLRVARNRLLQANLPDNRVTFLHENLLIWTPPTAAYDLIATHFVLDCFTSDQLSALIPRLARSARSEARWLVADFQVPAQGFFRRARARAILWLMYRFFHITTRLPANHLAPFAHILEQSGFIRRQRSEFDWGLLHAELWENTVANPRSIIGTLRP